MRRAMSRKPAGALVVAAAALLVIALPAAEAATVEVHLVSAQFQPATVNVAVNDTVVFINNDSFAHDVIFEAGFGTGAAGSLAVGANWSHTFNESGTFKFRCQLHSASFDTGMVGQVVAGTPTAPPPAPKSPGFELVGVLAALGLVAALRVRPRRS